MAECAAHRRPAGDHADRKRDGRGQGQGPERRRRRLHYQAVFTEGIDRENPGAAAAQGT